MTKTANNPMRSPIVEIRICKMYTANFDGEKKNVPGYAVMLLYLGHYGHTLAVKRTKREAIRLKARIVSMIRDMGILALFFVPAGSRKPLGVERYISQKLAESGVKSIW